MTRRMVRAGVAVAAAVGLVVSACGGGSDGDDAAGTGSDEEWVAVLASELAAEGSPFSQGDADCVASALVGVLGPAGVLGGDGASSDPALLIDDAALAGVDGTELGNEVLDCGISVGSMVAEAMGGDVDGALVDCLDEQFTSDTVGALLLAEMGAGSPDGGASSGEVGMDEALACAHHLDDTAGDTE